jgi:NADH-quinone oxidoreductase subunit J
MTVADVLICALGVLALGSGLLVVSTKHVVRAGLWLVVCLGAVAGIYLVLTAELVAWVQVLLYVGAVVVLLLFAVMLTRAPIGASDDLDRVRWPAILVGAGAGVALSALLAAAFRWTAVTLPSPGTAQGIGSDVFRVWVLPFEVVSVLLLAALIGAVIVSRDES